MPYFVLLVILKIITILFWTKFVIIKQQSFERNKRGGGPGLPSFSTSLLIFTDDDIGEISLHIIERYTLKLHLLLQETRNIMNKF